MSLSICYIYNRFLAHEASNYNCHGITVHINLVWRRLVLMNCLLWYNLSFISFIITTQKPFATTGDNERERERETTINYVRWLKYWSGYRKKLITNASLKNWCDSLSLYVQWWWIWFDVWFDSVLVKQNTIFDEKRVASTINNNGFD